MFEMKRDERAFSLRDLIILQMTFQCEILYHLVLNFSWRYSSYILI